MFHVHFQQDGIRICNILMIFPLAHIFTGIFPLYSAILLFVAEIFLSFARAKRKKRVALKMCETRQCWTYLCEERSLLLGTSTMRSLQYLIISRYRSISQQCTIVHSVLTTFEILCFRTKLFIFVLNITIIITKFAVRFCPDLDFFLIGS